ncbi:MAG: response regulator, partial [Gammaproteobacteria bacterium]|nr:response regulator [Gammaproteobacteria bacterium]
MAELVDSTKAKKVLIVGSDPDYRGRLAEIIREEGLYAIVANGGMQGMVKYYQDEPDLVLLDYKLQGMSSIEACRQLKALSNDRLVPIIIISGYLNDEAITECIQAGADDIVFKPFSMTIFRARIYAMFRIGDLYHKLCTLKNQRQSDEELAEQLFSEVVEKGNVAEDQIKIFKRSAETFSGDVQLTALCPNGDINVLLGDFTGHGLSSAIGAIPLSDTFRAMTDKGYGSLEIIKQINRKMH